MLKIVILRLPSALFCLLAVFWCTSDCESTLSQEQNDQAVKIELKVEAQKNVISPGEPLQIRVEIWNQGPTDVFICKDFELQFGPLCHLTIFLQDSSGQYGPREAVAIDLFPWKKEALSVALPRDWIALRRGHFYGATLTIDPNSYPRLQKPGRYRVLAQYSSEGLITGYQGTVSADSEELARLPAKSWQGEIESRPILIHVTPKK